MLAAETHFALNLLQKTGFNNSTIVSPVSISIALDLILLGAKEKTAEEIQNAFANGVNDVDEIHKYFSSIYKNVINSSAVKIANKIYYANDLCLLESYKNEIQKYYNASFQLADFTKSQKISNEINKFVADSTDKNIPEIVNPNMFNDETMAVLINAIYFEQKWAEPLEPRPPSLFFSSLNVTKEISMMGKTDAWRYYNTELYQFVELPYQCSLFSMYILLPHERCGLAKILKNIDASKILDLISASERKLGKVTIPEFNVESTFDLRKILGQLKINDAFDKTKANFSGVCNNKNLYINDMIHKAVINVDKEGTKAAAVTVSLFYECSGIICTTKPFEFTADHPFLYVIADKQKNIYFIGTFFN